jgi:hypothetical protein
VRALLIISQLFWVKRPKSLANEIWGSHTQNLYIVLQYEILQIQRQAIQQRDGINRFFEFILTKSENLCHLFVSLVVTVVNSYPYGPEFKSRHFQKMESRLIDNKIVVFNYWFN